MRPLLLLVAAYLLGSIPTSYWMGRARGLDLQAHGSGNLGATNAYRVLGAWPAAVTVLVDVSKGFVATWFFPLWDGSAATWLSLLYAAAAIAGHVWSVFVRFQGGKGVATGGGALLALAPLATLVALLAWIGLVLVTRIVSIASLTAAALVPLVAVLSGEPGEVVFFCVLAAVFVWWTHRSNLGRLRRGEEQAIRRTSDRAPTQAGEP